jgi:DNA polymerase-3 subunit alpha
MTIIRKVTKQELKDHLYDLDISDPNIYVEANNDNSIGIFQLNGALAHEIIKKIKPQSFDEINACSAFARPGTSSFVEQYVENREKHKSPYPKQVAALLTETQSIVLYQEQAMSIFNKIGGFTLEETDVIRGLMKKLGKADKKKSDLEKWDKVIEKFTAGAQENGINPRDAKVVAGDLLKMASYQFNKSHSTAYAYIAAQTLYLSYYFRKYFYASVLHYEVGRDKYLLDRLRSVKAQGFKILPPDINKSKISLSPAKEEKDSIIFGIFDIKGIGEVPATTIVSLQPFFSFMDFILKIQGKRISVTVIKALISIGAFDDLYKYDRKKLLATFEIYWKNKKTTKVPEKLRAVFEAAEKEVAGMADMVANYDDLRDFERKHLGFNFFINPFTTKFLDAVDAMEKKGVIYSSFSKVKSSSAKVPVVINKIKILNDKNGKEMAFLDIEDKTGDGISVPIFQSFWSVLKNRFVEGKIHMINLYLNDDQVMFGKKGYTKKDAEIDRFVKRLDNV